MRKLRFLLTEVLADMGIAKKDHGVYWLGTFIFAAVMLRLTIFLHHLGQFLALKFMNCPVEKFTFMPITSDLEYGYYFFWQQLVVLAVGPFTNTLLFYFFMRVNALSDKYIQCFPEVLKQGMIWYGFFTVFDFMVICVSDFASQKTNGDLFKLYQHYYKEDGQGFIGFFLTFIIEFFMMILNVGVFYNHIMFVHHDAKIADIWIRI